MTRHRSEEFESVTIPELRGCRGAVRVTLLGVPALRAVRSRTVQPVAEVATDDGEGGVDAVPLVFFIHVRAMFACGSYVMKLKEYLPRLIYQCQSRSSQRSPSRNITSSSTRVRSTCPRFEFSWTRRQSLARHAAGTTSCGRTRWRHKLRARCQRPWSRDLDHLARVPCMVAAVIFDLYGTLLRLPRDSQPYYQLACRHPSGNIRLALERAMTNQFPRLSDFATSIGLPPQDDLTALEADLHIDIAQIHSFEDAVPTVSALKRRGLLTAVISNLATPYKPPFAAHPLSHMMDVTVFSCDSGLLKPAPEIYRMALEQLGTTADDTIMVGDSFKSDVEGPSKIGMMGIHLVRSGKTSRAKSVISSLDAIIDLVAAKRILRSIRTKVDLLNRKVITPSEAADQFLCKMAHEKQFAIVQEAASLLPGTVHAELTLIVQELIRPGAPLRTFHTSGTWSKEEREEFDRRIHSQFIQVAELLRQYWANEKPA